MHGAALNPSHPAAGAGASLCLGAIQDLLDGAVAVLDEAALGLLDVQALVLARHGSPDLAAWFKKLVAREHQHRHGAVRGAPPALVATEASLRCSAFALGVMWMAIALPRDGVPPNTGALERVFWLVRLLLAHYPAAASLPTD